MKYFVLILALGQAILVQAQKENEMIQSGNDLYRKQQYDKAQQEYSNALKSQPANTTAKFNIAATTYRLNKQDEAIKQYDELVKTNIDADMRAKAFYNKGAILSKQKKLEESIEAYKSALRINPQDNEARENLRKAILELKKKEPPKQKDDQQKKKQQKQQQPKMNKKEAEQRLKLLEQKEKEVQQRLQKEKSKTGGSQTKDW